MNIVDKIVGYISPERGLRRVYARATLEQVNVLAGGNSGYEAGKLNRFNRGKVGTTLTENGIPRQQIHRMRTQSWELFRNNPHARKIVRSLESKVVGRGLHPQSQATNADGTANNDFRQRCKEIWDRCSYCMDSRGMPGYGGQTMAEQQKTALRGAILSGETLYRFKPLSKSQAAQRELYVPLQIQLIHANRLADNESYSYVGIKSGNEVQRGIELNPDGTRAAYWIYDRTPGDAFEYLGNLQPKRVPVEEIGHLYVAEDIDQLRGVPWFAAALMQMRDTGDYQFNELKASALAACVVMGYRRSTGQANFGVQQPDNWDLADADGNKITAVQPGMFLDLGQNGELQIINPARPNTSAEAWIQHMIRSTATGVPGVKSSTLTGDYRNSSFSSERSADNDAWPELEGVQDWIAMGFCQPIYVQVMRAAQFAGMFDDVISNGEFLERQHDLLCAAWQGPVALSINPKDDADAAGLRVSKMQSSVQRECSKQGTDWRANMRDMSEFLEYAEELDLPEALVNSVMGVEETERITDAVTGDPDSPVGSDKPAAPAKSGRFSLFKSSAN